MPEVDGVRDVGEDDVHDGKVEEEEAVGHAAEGTKRLPSQELVDHACNEKGFESRNLRCVQRPRVDAWL